MSRASPLRNRFVYLLGIQTGADLGAGLIEERKLLGGADGGLIQSAHSGERWRPGWQWCGPAPSRRTRMWCAPDPADEEQRQELLANCQGQDQSTCASLPTNCRRGASSASASACSVTKTPSDSLSRAKSGASGSTSGSVLRRAATSQPRWAEGRPEETHGDPLGRKGQAHFFCGQREDLIGIQQTASEAENRLSSAKPWERSSSSAACWTLLS